MRRIWNEEGPLVCLAVVFLALVMLVPLVFGALLKTNPDFVKHDCATGRAVICFGGKD